MKPDRVMAVLVCVALLAAAVTFVHAQERAKAPAIAPGDAFYHVTGVSKTGDLSAALRSAVDHAGELAARKGADMMIEWELEKVSGRQGGIAGFHEVSVKIRVPRAPR